MENERKHKFGDTGLDGRKFIGYRKTCKNGEWWVSLDKFIEINSKHQARKQNEEYQKKRKVYLQKWHNDPANKERQKKLKEARFSDPTKKEQARQTIKAWYSRPEIKEIRRKRWIEQSKDEDLRQKRKEYHKQYYSNPEKKKLIKRRVTSQIYKTKRNQWIKEKSKKDILFALKRRMSARTWAAFNLQGYRKNSKTAQMLGCSWRFLKTHIEKQFTKGMTWENRHLWQIDHIIPLASAKNEDQLKKLCHFSNLQPLWNYDNQSKSDKITTCQPELLLSHY